MSKDDDKKPPPPPTEPTPPPTRLVRDSEGGKIRQKPKNS